MMNQQVTRRDFLKVAAAGTAALKLPGCSSIQSENGLKRKPNIILVLADDLGYMDLGCYRQQKIKVPDFVRLVTNRMLMCLNFYNK